MEDKTGDHNSLIIGDARVDGLTEDIGAMDWEFLKEQSFHPFSEFSTPAMMPGNQMFSKYITSEWKMPWIQYLM